MAERSKEPFLWLFFSAGGVASALLLPALLLLFAVVLPLGWLAAPSHEKLLALLSNPLTRLVLFAVFVLSLIHAGHRFRYTLYEGLRMQHLNEVIVPLCYGGAIIGSLWAGYLLWQVR
ncbi:MAG: fumarate reductase subunit FrdD [Gemmatimonadaceae bacterium]